MFSVESWPSSLWCTQAWSLSGQYFMGSWVLSAHVTCACQGHSCLAGNSDLTARPDLGPEYVETIGTPQHPQHKFDFKEQVQDLQNSFSILTPDLFQLAVGSWGRSGFCKANNGKTSSHVSYIRVVSASKPLLAHSKPGSNHQWSELF